MKKFLHRIILNHVLLMWKVLEELASVFIWILGFILIVLCIVFLVTHYPRFSVILFSAIIINSLFHK